MEKIEMKGFFRIYLVVFYSISFFNQISSLMNFSFYTLFLTSYLSMKIKLKKTESILFEEKSVFLKFNRVWYLIIFVIVTSVSIYAMFYFYVRRLKYLAIFDLKILLTIANSIYSRNLVTKISFRKRNLRQT